jgi:hypothetical protein
MFSVKGWFSLGIEQMKELFCMEERKDKNDLIRRVVKAAQNELFGLYNKQCSNLFFTFFEGSSQLTFLIHQRHELVRKSTGRAKMIAVLLSNILDYEQTVIDSVLIRYSILHPMTDFSELFAELAAVKIHTESKPEQRAKILQILYMHSIHPNQDNTLWKTY